MFNSLEVKLLIKENGHKNLTVLREKKKDRKERREKGKEIEQTNGWRKEERGKKEGRKEFVIRVSDHQHQRKRIPGWNALVNLQ